MKDRILKVEEALEAFAQKKANPQSDIYEAARYSLLAGGKRLRPILLLEMYKACGGTGELPMSFACAIEMIHTYSLIHDDLPCMDNDDYRRGRLTNHKVFGEDMAVLAGDALLNFAFETALTCDKEPALVLKALSYMADCSGWNGMIGGQTVDIKNEGKEMTLDELQYIHSLKTGALIKAACVLGAILAGASDDKILAATRYAENLGIAFQIQDDILDVTGTAEELGKPIGSDAKNSKTTYITLLGLQKAKEFSEKYTKAAIEALDIFGDGADFLRDLTVKLTNRKN